MALLGLLGLRIFEACAAVTASIADLGEERGHRVLRYGAKAVRSSGSRAAATAAGGSPQDPDSGYATAGRSGVLPVTQLHSSSHRDVGRDHTWRQAVFRPFLYVLNVRDARLPLVAAFGGAGYGVIVVAVPAVVDAHQGSTALTGLLFAGYSAGELLGGLALGAASRRLPSVRLIAVGQTVLAAGAGGLVLLTAYPMVMLAVLVAMGVSTAPVVITSSALLDDLAAPGVLGRAYTTMVAVGLLGAAAGAWVGGVLTACCGGRAALLLAAVTAAGAAACAVARRGTVVSRTQCSAERGSDGSCPTR